MIFFNNKVTDLVEAVYLGEGLTEKIGDPGCSIYVNPDNIKYLVGKVVIINVPNYDQGKIKILMDNGCKVISRIEYPGVVCEPYILRVNPMIMWNGLVLGSIKEAEEYCGVFLSGQVKLCFPKVRFYQVSEVLDRAGNLTAYGWALQQVGINIKSDTRYSDMDLIKTCKVLPGGR